MPTFLDDFAAVAADLQVSPNDQTFLLCNFPSLKKARGRYELRFLLKNLLFSL